MLELMFSLLGFLSASAFDFVQKPPTHPFPMPVPKGD